MSNFWADRLAGAGPTAPPQAPVTPASLFPSANTWWADPVPQPIAQPLAAPIQTVPKTLSEALISPVDVRTTKAVSARSTGSCPQCGSGNYVPGHGNGMTRCFDCGYNPRFDQQAVGVSAGSASISTKQIDKGVNNFNPGQIVAHV